MHEKPASERVPVLYWAKAFSEKLIALVEAL